MREFPDGNLALHVHQTIDDIFCSFIIVHQFGRAQAIVVFAQAGKRTPLILESSVQVCFANVISKKLQSEVLAEVLTFYGKRTLNDG